MSEFDSHALPSFQLWRAAFDPPPDANAYLSENLSVTAATLFAELMAPALVVVRGCVLLRAKYTPENFEEWWSDRQGDVHSIERAINRLHLWDIFEPADEVEERAVEALAMTFATSWDHHAKRQFPTRTILVEVTDDYGPTVVMSSRLSA